MTTDKTVFVLGAGFSSPAGGPNQASLLGKIVGRRHQGKTYEARKNRLLTFLTDTMNIPDASLPECILEDVYTPIDRCIADGVSFRGKTPTDLEKIRDELDSLIAIEIKKGFEEANRNQDYVQKFARHLVRLAKKRSELAASGSDASAAKSYDPFSVITLNWDILLDNAIHSELIAADQDIGDDDYDPFGVVDYCCYISSFEKDDRRIRTGLWTLGCKGYNVKLLKIHGSLNWLQCMNCQRLYTGFGQKLAVSDKIGSKCRHCAKHGFDAIVRSALIMPTFLKDLSNFQIKLVWQNASVELMEARKIVFIGYSLPDADFEFRQLLSRMVHREAEIEVVLWGEAKSYEDEKSRFARFFAGKKISFEPAGVIEFVDKLPV